MTPLQYPSMVYRVRNMLRSLGVELVPARKEANLLGLHLDGLFASLGVSLVVDVGARVGDFATWLRANGYRHRICSFEPVSSNYAELAVAAATDPLWDVFQIALGRTSSQQSINVARGSMFSSFLEPNAYSRAEFGDSVEIVDREVVQVSTLDDILGETIATHPGGVYLKLDTQGFDLEVLAGGAQALYHVDALQMEMSVQPIYEGMATMVQSLETLREHSFALSGLFPVTVDHAYRSVEFDAVAVHDQGSTR